MEVTDFRSQFYHSFLQMAKVIVKSIQIWPRIWFCLVYYGVQALAKAPWPELHGYSAELGAGPANGASKISG
jgi:hypothetical protein